MASPTRVIEVVLPGGDVIYAEVMSAGPGDVSVADRLPLDQAADLVRRVGTWAVDTARSHLPERPDQFEVTFGMKLGAKSGKVIGILAEASGEASFTVRMLWNRPEPSPAPRSDTAPE